MARAGTQIREAFTMINKPRRLTILARAGTQIREAFNTINKPRRLAVLVSRYPE
ncbi:hypothetical protein [Methylobacter sp. S3L5C]|uniref:hypothetical protein n=1 Tax=Methylobacter sp. S3L5C TaxID=2839024 RepID=UPI001FABACB1|nr:hypothetical protein [Methylobacter sp. S3L5C]UOA08896.1 hypothetical protein KKZ03_00835 [Methylobacter sp. S3L5C]